MSEFATQIFAEQMFDEILDMSVGDFIEKYGFIEVEDLITDAVNIEIENRGE